MATTGFAPAITSMRTQTSRVESWTWARLDVEQRVDALQAAAQALCDRRRLLDRKRPGRIGLQGRRQGAQPAPHVPRRGPGRRRASLCGIQAALTPAHDEDRAAGPAVPDR